MSVRKEHQQHPYAGESVPVDEEGVETSDLTVKEMAMMRGYMGETFWCSMTGTLCSYLEANSLVCQIWQDFLSY